ncbi:DinB family protein [Streptomyces roseus]|uniref:DinB family protein n=1 Tax=Streptomyces roseus TaxID=66430 RepID=UPI0038001CA9
MCHGGAGRVLAVRGDRRLTAGWSPVGRRSARADRRPASPACRRVEPSNLSLLGLVRHVAGVEQYWFRHVMAGEDVRRHYRTAADPEADFTGAVADPEAVADASASWRAEVAFADRLVAGAVGLDVVGQGGEEPLELREVLVRMIEEYGRHNGHAEFLRERIVGWVGGRGVCRAGGGWAGGGFGGRCARVRGREGFGGVPSVHCPSVSVRAVKGAPCGRVAPRWPSATLDCPARPGKTTDCREAPEGMAGGLMTRNGQVRDARPSLRSPAIPWQDHRARSGTGARRAQAHE